MSRRLLRRVLQLLIGLVLYGVGLGLMVRGAIGVPPWDVLTQGLVNHFGLSFGLWTNIIGLVVLLLWIPLRQLPGLGTVLNVLMIGPSAQLVLWLLPEQDSLWIRIPLFVAGLLAVAIASGLYIGANLGPGPRDGLMTGLHRRTGLKIWIVRTGIEVTVLAIGWILGGNVGIGTLAFALLIGPMVGVTLGWFTVQFHPAAPPSPSARPSSRSAARRYRPAGAHLQRSVRPGLQDATYTPPHPSGRDRLDPNEEVNA